MSWHSACLTAHSVEVGQTWFVWSVSSVLLDTWTWLYYLQACFYIRNQIPMCISSQEPFASCCVWLNELSSHWPAVCLLLLPQRCSNPVKLPLDDAEEWGYSNKKHRLFLFEKKSLLCTALPQPGEHFIFLYIGGISF